MKNCKACNEEKPSVEFYARDSKCKPCRRLAVSAYREANIEKVKEYDRARGRTEERKEKAAARRPRYIDRRPQYIRKWQSQNPEKRAAHVAVGNAIRDGKLVKGCCEGCGSKKVQAHHDDYSKPLVVRWLCTRCHGAEHVALRWA